MTRLRFLGDVSLLGGLALAVLAGALCYWLYRRETARSGLPYGRLLPFLRSVAVVAIVLMLTGPTLQHRTRLGEPGKLTIVIDDSESMSVTDGEPDSRYQRAVDGLLKSDPELLPTLAESFEVRVVRASDRESTELWSSTLEREMELPESSADWLPSSFRGATALGDALEPIPSAAVVLMTDGQVNEGASLLESAQRAAYGSRPIFAVGFGASDAPPDLAIAEIEHPDRIFRRDVLSGKLMLRDAMPAGQSFRLQAWCGEMLAWEQSLVTEGKGPRSVAFQFPVEKLVDASSKTAQRERPAMNVERSSVPLSLEFRIADCAGDTNALNNRRAIQMWGDLHRSRVLLLDGRSRWETRYLKNVFERDPFWEINAVIAEPAELLGGGGRLPVGKGPGKFPESRDAVMEYDLVIVGELPSAALSPLQQSWLVDLVNESGGGLIAIDGSRDAWSAPELGTLASLLPVRRLSDASKRSDSTTAIHLTSTGRSLTALKLGDDFDDEVDRWSSLARFHWLASTEAIPGSEVLATDTPDSDSENAQPIFVTRFQGAGRVFYSATDETWRWRYKVADEIHRRLWNQLARWIMRTPYVIESEFVSLDAGRMTYRAGQEVEIRCRLKNDDGTPFEKADVQAIVQGDGEQPTMIHLVADEDVPGVYGGTVNSLAKGGYTVGLSASGIPRDALAVETRLVVASEESVELANPINEVATLRRVAELTGGVYLPEDEIASLQEHLKPLSQGRIVESETVLWQSYAWFLPVVLCLSVEWWLRKRAGLI